MGGMFGGSGTTANSFAYLLWATLRQPVIVKRLKEELKEAFPEGSRTDSAVSILGICMILLAADCSTRSVRSYHIFKL